MAIVLNKGNNQLYRYIGNDVFRNIASGKEGIVDPKKAEEVFVVHSTATLMIEEFPIIETLINKLKMKVYVNA